MKYNGAVFFDSDGTITDDKSSIYVPTDATIKSLQKLKENGYLTVLSTGRAEVYAKHVIKYFEGVSTTNGTYVTVDGKCIADLPIENNLLKNITNYMDENDVSYTLENHKMCYVKSLNDERFNAWIDKFGISKDAFSDDVKYKTGKFYKISVMYNTQLQCENMRNIFKSLFSIDMHSDCLFGDITRSCYGKGTGVKKVIDYFNIPFEKTYAFGDGENDISMFDAVANGIAMGWHAPLLKIHASFITKNVKDEGITYGLQHFGLI